MEQRRAYADSWVTAIGSADGQAWGSVEFREFVALDEHLAQLEVAVTTGGPARLGHQQYVTDSGLFNAPLQQRLLDPR